jgi:hypothetical protein
MAHSVYRHHEKTIQKLIALHPYLLDEAIPQGCHGQLERPTSSGRIDITFDQNGVLIIVECKARPLRKEDFQQLKRYINDLKNEGAHIDKAYLVGLGPTEVLSNSLREGGVEICVRILNESIPLQLAWCCKHKRYYNLGYRTCPICGSPGDPEKSLDLSFVC